eukprot:IDg4953t1
MKSHSINFSVDYCCTIHKCNQLIYFLGLPKIKAGDDNKYKIQKFNGRYTDNYNLRRLRATTARKGKKYWTALQSEKCSNEIKDKATALLANALGDMALRVCSSEISDLLKMLKLIDSIFASNRSAARISVPTTIYSKRHNGTDNMAKFVDEFESLFAQLKRMGD